MLCKRKQKGQLSVWIVVVSMLAICSLLYLTFDAKMFQTTLRGWSGQLTEPGSVATWGILNTVWTYWPIVMIVGAMMFLFVAAQRRGPND